MYKGNLYVGTFNNNKVLVLKNEEITKSYTISDCASIISGITIDKNGYMAISCYGSASLFVYDNNGKNMNVSMHTPPFPYLSAIDSMGRLIMTSGMEFSIYY
jgi:hypothetical protein